MLIWPHDVHVTYGSHPNTQAGTTVISRDNSLWLELIGTIEENNHIYFSKILEILKKCLTIFSKTKVFGMINNFKFR